MLSAASQPTLAKNARMGHPLFVMGMNKAAWRRIGRRPIAIFCEGYAGKRLFIPNNEKWVPHPSRTLRRVGIRLIAPWDLPFMPRTFRDGKRRTEHGEGGPPAWFCVWPLFCANSSG